MGYDLNINGLIGGISEESFDLIKDDLEDVFTEVSFKDNTIKIYSCGNHPDEILNPVFNKLAFCIDGDGSGQLDLEGEECGDFSTIFFVQRQWKQVWLEMYHPADPFLLKRLHITCSRIAYVHVNPSMLNQIKNELDGQAHGNEDICIASGDLKTRLDSGDIENKETDLFLKAVHNALIEQVGDIMFHT